MKHLGDITKIKGCDAPVVDCIIGGSPCQDLSVAGKRAGLAGERSGLYMEQIRIIKEMRHKDELRGRTGESIRPRYMVWENVPGAFSSNKGKDFAAVLEEAIKVVEPEAPDVPVPEKGWPTSGCIVGDKWSVAWRVLDAQFWGVPQRRRRIALVADFGGQSAPEILFIRKGVSRDLDESQQERKATAGDAENRTGADDRDGSFGVDIYNLAVSGDKAVSLTTAASATGSGPTVAVPYSIENHPVDSRVDIDDTGKVQTLTSRMGTGGGNVPMVMEPVTYNGANITSPINATNPQPGDPCHMLNTDARNYVVEPVTFACHNNNSNNVVRVRYIVRRLTPLECERLQGFPSELNLDVSKMTKDEYIAWNIYQGNIIVDAENGKVYRTRGPGGTKLDKPQEMKGSDCNGYLVVKISNGTTKLTCRIHRIVWISQHGIVPEGYCIDHINSDKKDNRISNLQLLTPAENSTKASKDGLYATGEDNVATKVSPDLWDEIAYLHHIEGHTMRQLAEMYGISKSRVQQIVKEVGWTDIGEWVDSKGKKHKESDSPRYKALGNSIAIPPWKWVLKRLCACYERDATMASLFDGIGGFPYIWEQLNGKGSCLWASEIEEFPMAVTKLRFGGN